ncbi:MAG: UbiA family prenyltransferase [Clostridiaceae bacterium]|nr:UbiA family prenyltransferase [Clostridiaceae bacterium]
MLKTIRRLFNYVEIKTKITSVFPFIMTLGYLFLNGKHIDYLRSIVFFFGMFLFDLTATTINNYNDTKNNNQLLAFSRRTSLNITLVLLLLSTALGIWLAALTDIVVLLAGMLCFFFGIIYSYGPIPISHGPYGEAVSGFFYGALIPFILIHINAPGWLVSLSLSLDKISLTLNPLPLLGFILLAVLPFCLTANIMLANNICDLEHDTAVRRYTLAYYLKRRAIYLFALLYYTVYASVVMMVILRFLTPLSLLLLVTFIPVQKNIHSFFMKQDKEETFILSIKNFLLIISVHIILIFLGGLLPGWGT